MDRGSEFELVIAGDGELRPSIEGRIRDLGLHAVVRISGWISAAEVRTELLAARALVLPSFAEGLPVVIMEAMALSRPVITTYVAGIPELVLDGQTGWLVPAGDVERLADAIVACLAAGPETLARMGSAGRDRVLERHDADIEAAKLALLVERHGGGSALRGDTYHDG
jgi:glycosyltransferase involved in cell wall biosynthesis